MKISEFIKERKIKPHMAAGLLAHLRLDGDREMKEDHLDEAYRQFAGLPDRETTEAKTELPAESNGTMDTEAPSAPEPTNGDEPDGQTPQSNQSDASQPRSGFTGGRSARRRGNSTAKDETNETETETGDE